MRILHCELEDDLSGEILLERFARNRRLIESLAAAIFHRATETLSDPPGGAINPQAITLKRDHWEAEGLFDVRKAVAVDEIAARTMEQIRVCRAVAGKVAHAG